MVSIVNHTAVVLTVFTLSFVPLVTGDPFIVEIGSGQRQCFNIVADATQKVYGSYGVNWGGKLDIKPLVEGPDKELIYSLDDEEVRERSAGEEGSFEFFAEKEGIYTFCLLNEGGVSVAVCNITQPQYIIISHSLFNDHDNVTYVFVQTKSVTFSLHTADDLKQGALHASS